MPKKPKPILVTQRVRRQQDTGVLLVTGFEPFGGEEANSSELVARALHGQVIGGLTVVSVVLPCVFATAPGVLQQALEQWQPRLVLALGQAAGRNELSLERVAINLMDAPIKDNAGEQPTDVRVVVDGPPAHFTTLPVKAMVNAMRNAGLPAGLSNSAGTLSATKFFTACSINWPMHNHLSPAVSCTCRCCRSKFLGVVRAAVQHRNGRACLHTKCCVALAVR